MTVSAAHTGRAWWRDALIYQVYVRSFADSTGNGVGDLDGIRHHLDYIAALGVDGIWLNPCYPSPQRDHGYDVSDYFSIDPEYGTLEVFDALVAGAHERSLRVLMDIVPNHCSDQHPWFRAALAAPPGSAERDRFWFRDGRPDAAGGDGPPNNWLAGFGGSAWTRASEAGAPADDPQWYLGTFSPYQPDFNHTNPDVAAMFAEVLEFWFDRGVDGFRVDAIQPVGKHPDLPDQVVDPPDLDPLQIPWTNEFTIFRPEGHDVWRAWRHTIDRYAQRHGRELMMVAEAYLVRQPELMAEFTEPDQFHQAFAFDVMLSPWDQQSVRRSVDDPLLAYSLSGSPPAWTLNNHDTQRIVTRLGRPEATDPNTWTDLNLKLSSDPGDDARGTRRARASIVFTAALPGALYLYQGEELGLPEVLDIPLEQRQDPVVERTGGETLGRDGCRVPMPWHDAASANFGFSPDGSRNPSWLPQPDDWGDYAVSIEVADPESTLQLYRAMATARRALRTEPHDIDWIDVGNAGLGFRRGRYTVILNLSSVELDVGTVVDDEAEAMLWSGTHAPAPTSIPADSAVWFRHR
ncbi:MAG: alpha-glucosidase [Ilumatobacteraceae bacterium]|nr:alpha-glucosidase [Ilumatobacteraceae bacterium]